MSEEIRPIRKTSFMMYKHCEKQFDYFYKDPNYFSYGETTNASEAQKKGTAFHAAAEDMFKKLNTITLDTLRSLPEDKVESALRVLLPSGTEIDEWFDYFAKVESLRFLLGKKLHSDILEKVFIPRYIELPVELKDVIPRTGHADRIDYLPGTNSLCIVEYKTGNYYDFTKPNVLTGLRAETGWYAQILNGNKQLDLPITHWACVNPTRRSVHAEKFSPISLKSVESNYAELVGKIKTNGPWERNMSPLCMYCNYQTDCLYSLPAEQTMAGYLAMQGYQENPHEQL